MPRIARGLSDGFVFHVLNRGNGRQEVFHKDGDYHAFGNLIEEALDSFNLKLFAYCIMPNHFHFLLQPSKGEDLSKFMQWLMTSHVRRYHQHYGTSGHVWQGRYKSFIVQEDQHLLTVLRYVEGNPVRAQLVESAKSWRWSSHRERIDCKSAHKLSALPVPLPNKWTEYIDTPMTSSEVESLRRSVNRQAPFGEDRWVHDTCDALGLNSTIRERGRPKREQ
jgi:putative transposase